MPLGTVVGLGPGDIVLDVGPSSPLKWAQPTTFRPLSIVAKRSPISATAEHLYRSDLTVQLDCSGLFALLRASTGVVFVTKKRTPVQIVQSFCSDRPGSRVLHDFSASPSQQAVFKTIFKNHK